METIKKQITNRAELDLLFEAIMDRVMANQPISDNGMRDGVVYGFMLSNAEWVCHFLFGHKSGSKPALFNGTRQKMEIVIEWLQENEGALLDMYNTKYALMAI